MKTIIPPISMQSLNFIIVVADRSLILGTTSYLKRDVHEKVPFPGVE